jgi:hypothetical protein
VKHIAVMMGQTRDSGTGFRVIENRVPRSAFGPKTDETLAGWGKLPSDELHNFSSSKQQQK